VAIEVHRVVEESHDLQGAGTEPVEEDVPRGSATLGDVEGANPRANIIARLATARILGDRLDGLLMSLRYSRAWTIPQRSFVYARTSITSRLACGERITRIMRELWTQPNRGVDLSHELVDGTFYALPSVELGDAHVQRLAKLVAHPVAGDLWTRRPRYDRRRSIRDRSQPPLDRLAPGRVILGVAGLKCFQEMRHQCTPILVGEHQGLREHSIKRGNHGHP
jgi:hypothetical protein